MTLQIRDVTHYCMWDESFINESFHVYIRILPEYIISRTWKWLIHNREMKHSYLGSVFLCSEWSTREKKKRQRIFLVFMSYIWVSECPVTRMMGTHSFFHISFFTNSIIFSHFVKVFPLTHECVLTHFFRALKHLCTFLFSLTHKWVSALSHIWLNDCLPCGTIQVTLMKEWRLVLMSRIWGVIASLRCEWVMSHMWMSESHVTYMNEWALLMSLNSCDT